MNHTFFFEHFQFGLYEFDGKGSKFQDFLLIVNGATIINDYNNLVNSWGLNLIISDIIVKTIEVVLKRVKYYRLGIEVTQAEISIIKTFRKIP